MASAVQEQSTERAVLSPEQREFFDANGYLVVEDALPSKNLFTKGAILPKKRHFWVPGEVQIAGRD